MRGGKFEKDLLYVRARLLRKDPVASFEKLGIYDFSKDRVMRDNRRMIRGGEGVQYGSDARVGTINDKIRDLRVSV